MVLLHTKMLIYRKGVAPNRVIHLQGCDFECEGVSTLSGIRGSSIIRLPHRRNVQRRSGSTEPGFFLNG